MKATLFEKVTMTVGVLLLGVVPSCNMDGMFEDNQPPKGPTVSTDGSMDTRLTASTTLDAVERQEVDLVENVLSHRARYYQGLEDLRDYYREHGYATKQSWAEFELEGLRRVKAFRYVIDAEIPSNQLRPTEQISEADALYDQGRALMKKGGYDVPIFYRERSMIKAADVFRELIDRYPNSDKIDDAAFYLGEIHNKYLPDQEPIAVTWYERAWTWDPQTPHPARFEAAVIYDKRLHDRDRALELYQNVLKDETADRSDVRYAARRIRQLTNEPLATTAPLSTP